MRMFLVFNSVIRRSTIGTKLANLSFRLTVAYPFLGSELTAVPS